MRKISLLLVCLLSFSLMFAEKQLPILRINFPANTLVYAYYTSGTMTLEDTDGTIVELPAKFKTRGATALKYTMKPSFNMKLETEEGEEIDYNLLGLRKASSFILDAMAIDRICMRNRVCFDIWNSFSHLPYDTDFDSRNGTVGKFVIVYMNDEYKGIYCLTDKINRKLLDLKKPKVDGNDVTIRGVLYKSGTTDIGNQETVGFYNDYMVYVAAWHDAWELKEPDDYPSISAWQPLIDYYEHKTQEYVSQNFEVDNLIDYSLFIMALGISDNWGNKNKYFSMQNCQGTELQKKFVVTPWDLDTSLGGHYDGNYYDGTYSDWTVKQVASSANLPFSLCFGDQQVKERMKERWEEVRNNAFSVENVSGIMNYYCDLFYNSGAWEEYITYWNAKSSRPKYVEDLRKEINLILEWYADRFIEMDNYFGINTAGLYDITDSDHLNDIIYNLMGMPVDKSQLKPNTVYIRNGKKFILKD